MRNNLVADVSPETADIGHHYIHCTQCLREWRESRVPVTPRTFARQQSAITADGRRLQVWCVRHETNIAVFDLKEDTSA